LVTHYIKWALQHPNAFKHILAVTFTNRSTQEMKQRMVNNLYCLATGTHTVLQEALCQSGWDPSQLQARSKEVLSCILYQYSDFSVTTIDGFFYKIVQAFSKELGLMRHFTLEMDQRVVLQEVIDTLVDQLPDTPLLQQWIIEFALQKLVAGKTWNVQQDMQQVGNTLFDEAFKLYETNLITALEKPESVPQFAAKLDAVQDAFESKMAQIGQKALDCIVQAGLLPTDFAYGERGIWGYFFNLATKKSFEPSKRTCLARDDAASWLTKNKRQQAGPIGRLIDETLHPLLLEALTAYEQDGRLYRTAGVLSRYRYTFGTIAALMLGLEAYRSKHRVLFLSDIATLLFQLIRDNETPFLYEKIGNQYHHFLIDEFQDLSVLQWMNIKPLVHNSLAQGFTNLVVGDVKQSIYRWRGSQWKLLNHQVASEFKETRVHALTTNRRSKETIVRFNNAFFSTAAKHLFQQLESELTRISEEVSPESVAALRAEFAQMQRSYEDVSQEPTNLNHEDRGCVALMLLRFDASEPTTEVPPWNTRWQTALRMQLDQLKQADIPAQDVVFLVRDNKEADWLTKWFNCPTDAEPMPYGVQSDQTSFLSSHSIVKILIHALYYLVNEKDVIHQVAFVQGYCKGFANQSVVLHTGTWQEPLTDVTGLLPKAFVDQKAYLKQLSVYSCVERLIVLLFPGHHEEGLSCFQSVVLDFCSKEATSIEAFLSWWEKRGNAIKLPTPAASNAIRITTIHQSKGLEFRAVLVPFCQWNLDHMPNKSPILWSDCAHPLSYFAAWPLKYGIDLKGTHYAQVYHLERLYIHLDNLNLLYVAFTRAVERLYVTAPLPADAKNLATTADLLYQSIAAMLDTDYKSAIQVQDSDLGVRFCMD
jgi:ATP-dependent exoDNAse (exonuclease V) beta subunit